VAESHFVKLGDDAYVVIYSQPVYLVHKTASS